ncbi:hypothetical protein IWW47_006410 [Coemansia sp. RSA 2052]|nr:hypothetical protein IWW47_006410 [Coemansia sp. RSA 2052]
MEGQPRLSSSRPAAYTTAKHHTRLQSPISHSHSNSHNRATILVPSISSSSSSHLSSTRCSIHIPRNSTSNSTSSTMALSQSLFLRRPHQCITDTGATHHQLHTRTLPSPQSWCTRSHLSPDTADCHKCSTSRIL